MQPMTISPDNRGTLIAHNLQSLVDAGHIASHADITQDQIQPASLDLTLSSEVVRMPGSILPIAGERIQDVIDGLALERLSCSSPSA